MSPRPYSDMSRFYWSPSPSWSHAVKLFTHGKDRGNFHKIDELPPGDLLLCVPPVHPGPLDIMYNQDIIGHQGDVGPPPRADLESVRLTRARSAPDGLFTEQDEKTDFHMFDKHIPVDTLIRAPPVPPDLSDFPKILRRKIYKPEFEVCS